MGVIRGVDSGARVWRRTHHRSFPRMGRTLEELTSALIGSSQARRDTTECRKHAFGFTGTRRPVPKRPTASPPWRLRGRTEHRVDRENPARCRSALVNVHMESEEHLPMRSVSGPPAGPRPEHAGADTEVTSPIQPAAVPSSGAAPYAAPWVRWDGAPLRSVVNVVVQHAGFVGGPTSITDGPERTRLTGGRCFDERMEGRAPPTRFLDSVHHRHRGDRL